VKACQIRHLLHCQPMQSVATRRIPFRSGIHGVQGVASSNLVAPTNYLRVFRVCSVSAFVSAANADIEALQKAINDSGFPLQLGLDSLANSHRDWRVILTEHPWLDPLSESDKFKCIPTPPQ
jgi:hypothetical protein